SEDEFLILACDGVYEAFSSEELVYLARSRLAVTDDLVAVTSQLLDMALSQGSRDNLSLILVVFDAAPRPSKPAIDRETTWWHQLRTKIA
ncbi:phosphatase 2C beta, partial [Aphelenchoides avenae]